MKFPSLFLLLILFNYIFLISKCLASEGTQIGDDVEQGESIIGNFSFLMPHVHPTHNDAYFCLEMKVESAIFIVDYHIAQDNPKPHHIVVFGVEHSVYDIQPKIILDDISLNKTLNRTAPVECHLIYGLGKSNDPNPVNGKVSFLLGWTPMTPMTPNAIPKGGNHW